MSWGIVAVAGVSLVSGAMSSSASKKAAAGQVAAADRATEAERQAMERQIALQAPWREAGGLGLNRLAYELGLSPTGTFTPGAKLELQPDGSYAPSGPNPMESIESVRARLAPNYPQVGNGMPTAVGNGEADNWMPGTPSNGGGALESAVQKEMERLQAEQTKTATTATQANALATTNANKDPAYGNLLRDFSMADYQADPGYAFRVSEGQKALDRAASAGGRFNSGRAAKDLIRFGQGEGAQEYSAAFNRFNVNQGNRYNRLASISGVGQTATNQTGSAVGNFGSSSAANAIGAGNAQAAGRVGAANAVSGGISQGLSSYQNNQLMNRFFPQGGGNSMQAGFSQTGAGSSGFGTGLAYGNQDMGAFL